MLTAMSWSYARDGRRLQRRVSFSKSSRCGRSSGFATQRLRLWTMFLSKLKRASVTVEPGLQVRHDSPVREVEHAAVLLELCYLVKESPVSCLGQGCYWAQSGIGHGSLRCLVHGSERSDIRSGLRTPMRQDRHRADAGRTGTSHQRIDPLR